MAILWRVTDYANLLGERGLLYDARWHFASHRIVYLAASPAGAMLEILIHLELNENELPESYQLLEVHAPDELIPEKINLSDQPADWKLQPLQTRTLGSEWLRSARTALATVPSAILPGTWNYLLNPDHPDAARVQMERAMKPSTTRGSSGKCAS